MSFSRLAIVFMFSAFILGSMVYPHVLAEFFLCFLAFGLCCMFFPKFGGGFNVFPRLASASWLCWFRLLVNCDSQRFSTVFINLTVSLPCDVLQDDLSVHLRKDLHLPLASLTADTSDVADKLSVPRVPEICFMSDDSNPESISSWLNNKFTADTTSPLLRCESCKLLVHASELISMPAN